MNIAIKLIMALATGAIGTVYAQTPPLEGTPIPRRSDLPHAQGFVSRGDSVNLLLNALGAQMKLSVIVSAKAERKKVSGSFDLAQSTATLNTLSAELGLIWFSDGQSLYVYDAVEMRNAVGHMRSASIATLNDFLRKAGLADARYPVRGSSSEGTFYVSGPPGYVDIVLNAAHYIDDIYRGADVSTQHIEVIRLEHSFVGGRRYGMRGNESVLPGIADVLQRMLGSAEVSGIVVRPPAIYDDAPAADDGAVTFPLLPGKTPGGRPGSGKTASVAPVAEVPDALTVVMPYVETNSLLVRGTLAQIQKVKNLVAEIDTPRRQIELSLWIIDIRKDELDQLGVSWSGEVGVGNKVGIGFNQGQGVSTLDGARFLASIAALSKTGKALVVSRPILLAQENIMAHFDSNHTFYTRLQAERVASLESVTFGTLVSVVPRISSKGEIEMQLQIEDGANSGGDDVDGLPVIGRTSIDTVARVPQSLSLLIGGYTRQAQESVRSLIPGLGRLPLIGGAFRYRKKQADSLVRVFLIQPRVLGRDDAMTAPRAAEAFGSDTLMPMPEMYRRMHRDIKQDGAPANDTQH
jgi:type II secretory pathway component GspD/PulD (secretin)